MRKILLFGLLVLALVGYNNAWSVTKVGTTAAPFLSIGVGARAIAMGGSFVSLANDATAMYWNPAGIARLPRNEITLNHTKWIADINYNYVGAVFQFGESGTIGANMTYLSMGEMERTTEQDPEGMGEKFSVGSFAIGLSYARNLTDRFSIGFNAKYIQEHIWHCKATGLAVDIGTLFTTQFNGLRIGMSISNFGTKMQMMGSDLLVQKDISPIAGNNPNINANLSTDKYDLPLLMRVGVSMDVLRNGDSWLTLSVDANHPNDNTECLNLGGEYCFNEFLFLRGGYKSLYTQDTEEGATLGAGLKCRIASRATIKVDYAWESFGRFDNIQKLSLGMSF